MSAQHWEARRRQRALEYQVRTYNVIELYWIYLWNFRKKDESSKKSMKVMNLSKQDRSLLNLYQLRYILFRLSLVYYKDCQKTCNLMNPISNVYEEKHYRAKLRNRFASIGYIQQY